METSPHSSSEPQLRDHVYDGIQEYDQKLPNWWLFSWYITMVWFVVWWLSYYQFGVGRTDPEEMEVAAAFIKQTQDKALAGVSDDKIWAMSRDPQVVAAGKATFMTSCVACHAPDLSAKLAGNKLPGLPLNDTEWKHGGTPTQVLNIVRKGAPDVSKGMPPWEPVLGTQRVVEAVAFILSHHKEGEAISLAPDSPLKGGSTAPAGSAASSPAPVVPAAAGTTRS